MNIIYFIIHIFTGCPDDDLEWVNKDKRAICKKCGRVYFNFEM